MTTRVCDKECGAVMHMTGGFHRTDCAMNKPSKVEDLQQKIVRLFTTDEGEISECATPAGSWANLRIQRVIKELVQEMSDSNYSLRDVEALMLSAVQMNIARAIISRRKLVDLVAKLDPGSF